MCISSLFPHSHNFQRPLPSSTNTVSNLWTSKETFQSTKLDHISTMASTYSQDETVAAITDYYKFFTKLPYVDPSALHLAPSGGWPSINGTELRKRGKTAEAIELLRHLPYLQHESACDNWTIDAGCVCIQYHKGVCYKDITDDTKRLPDHVIPIAQMADRNGHYLLLDTHTGEKGKPALVQGFAPLSLLTSEELWG